MTFPPDLAAKNLSLLIGPKAESETMIELAATLALRGPVRVLDGGNRFDAFRLARLIRRQTPQLDQALERVQVARAFTCYQVVTLFEQTPAVTRPQLVLDLLATFYDENVSLKESHRLLRIVLGHLDRLRRQAPVAVSIHPPSQPERAGLVDALKEAADHVLIRETPLMAVPIRLL
jgi:hypothetical protein